MKPAQIYLVLLALSICARCQQQVSTPLTLQSPETGTLPPKSYSYFSITMPEQSTISSILIITAYTSSRQSRPDIFISSTSQYPTLFDSQQSCFFMSLDTCSKTGLTANQTVYASVYCYDGCEFTVVATVTETQAVELGHEYQVDFAEGSSGVVSFEGQGYDYVLVVAEYENYYTAASYGMVLGVDRIPSDGDYDYQATPLGAFRKAIKLPIRSPNSTYYLLLSGQPIVNLRLSLTGQNTDSLTVPLNNTLFDIVTANTTYSMSYPKSNTSYTDDLIIRMREASGYGTIKVTYCGELEFTFVDMSGENGELVVDGKDRQACVESNMGLMVENLQIQVSPYYGQMGIILSIFQGDPQQLTVTMNQQQYGILQPNTTRKYRLVIYESTAATVQLTNFSYSGSPTFQLKRCSTILGCFSVNNSSEFTYDPQECGKRCYYQLVVGSGEEDTAKFAFVFKLKGYHLALTEGKADTGFVEMNDYVFYRVVPQNMENATSVRVDMEAISGAVTFLTSRIYEEPVFSDIWKNGSDVVYVWNGTATYYDNLDQPIYVGIMGETEGLYRISYTVGRNQNLPSSYILLSDTSMNQFQTTNPDKPLLLKYSPHSIPYTLSIWPRPTCLSYGPTLPLPSSCLDPLPMLITTPLYLNLSVKANTTYRVYVSEGEFLLTEDKPLFIECEESCYETVVVQVEDYTERVVHSGYGRLVDERTKQEVSNGILEVACENNQSSCEVTLLARLAYGGQMTLTLQSSNILQLTWWTSTLTLSALPRKLFYKLPKSTSTVISIDSKGAVLKIATNLQLLQSNYSNLMQLEFSDQYETYGGPFSRNSMVEVSENEAMAKGCAEPTGYCVLTLQVELDTEFQYSKEFVENGVAYVSAASGTSYLYENIRTRRISQDGVQYFEYRSNQKKNVTVLLEPISNCNPVLLYTDQEGVFPTTNNYTQKSHVNITAVNITHIVVGVKSEEICVYDLIVLTNEQNYTFMVQGMPYKLYLPGNSTTYLLFNSRTSQPFSIQSTVSSLQFCANPIPYGQSPNTLLPTPSNSSYHTSSSPLSITPNQTSNYVISIHNPHSYLITPTVMARYEQETITLLHSIPYLQTPEENQTDSYRYFTASSFYLFFMSSKGQFRVNVSTYDGSVNNTYVVDERTEEPYVLIQVDGRLTVVDIEVESLNSGKYTIQVIEYGSQGRPSLERGLPFFDSFTSKYNVNCYKLLGKAGDSNPIQLSFVFSQDAYNLTHNSSTDLPDLLPQFFYHFQLANSSSPLNQPKLLKASTFPQGISYRIEQLYGYYTFCFEGRPATYDMDYYVIVASREMQSLMPSVPYYETHFVNKSSSSYELVVLENETIVAELMSCRGNAQLTATTNYSAILEGKTTEILAHYKDTNGAYYSGLANATRGYFYVNVQSLTPNNTYILSTTSYPVSNNLSLVNWRLPSINLKYHHQGDSLYIFGQPAKCISNCSTTAQLTFRLFISSDCSNIMSYSRCGINETSEKILSYRLVVSPSHVPGNISWKVPTKLLPQKFSIAAKVQALQSQYGINRTVPYFYNTTMNLNKVDVLRTGTSSVSWGTLLGIMFVVIVLLMAGILVMCKKRGLWIFKPRQTVNFELTPLNTRNSSSRPPEMEMEEKKDRDPAPAYGEFVDESRL